MIDSLAGIPLPSSRIRGENYLLKDGDGRLIESDIHESW